MKKQLKHLLIVLAIVTLIAILGKLILGAVLTKIIFWTFIILGLTAVILIRCKIKFFILLALLLPAAQSSAQEIWIPTPIISPGHLPTFWVYRRTMPVVQWTPAHSRQITQRDAWVYRITPYGGTNYRTNWTNYRPRDTSWGYRQAQ